MFTHRIIILASADTNETSYKNYLIDGVTPVNTLYNVDLFKPEWTYIDLFKDFIKFYKEESFTYREALDMDEPNYFEDFVSIYALKRFNIDSVIFKDLLWLLHYSDEYCYKFLDYIYIVPIDVLEQYKYLGVW